MDWNEDGKKDLIVGEGDGHVRIYLNTNTDADPVFSGFSYLQVGGVDYDFGDCASPSVVDWDNDGRKDLLVGIEPGQVFLLLNTNTDADPVFASSDPVQNGGGGLTVVSAASPLAVDWNEDGAKDLLVGDGSGQISFFENLGPDSAPLFDGVLLMNVAFAGNSRFDTVDWNNDGVRDIICGSKDGDVYTLQGEYGYYPDLAVEIFAGPAQAEPNEQMGSQLALIISNRGNAALRGFHLNFYLSDDPEITADDTELKYGLFYITEELEAGEVYTVDVHSYVRIPATAAAGSYYLGPLLDIYGEAWELDEDNNDTSCPIEISPTDPVADIEANGSDTPVTIDLGESLNVKIALNANNGAGNNSDWWVLIDTAFGWYRYNLAGGSFVPGLAVTHQGPLFALSPYTVFNGTYLPAGSYKFYFGVDGNMNGAPDLGQMYLDSIDVTVVN